MSTTANPLRVCKLGGSLLEEPWLSARLQAWLARQAPIRTVIVVGGGTGVDLIRQRWQSGKIDDATAHWEAIRAMGHNAKQCQRERLLPNGVFHERIEELRQHPTATEVFFDAFHYLRGDDGEHPRGALPAGWDVTSDSIAARLADVLHAEELVLWKSTSPPDPPTIAVAQAARFVDAYFDRASGGIGTIRWVNLRGGWEDEGTLRIR